jgi:predicted ATP-dependent endonuclease of OLD family
MKCVLPGGSLWGVIQTSYWERFSRPRISLPRGFSQVSVLKRTFKAYHSPASIFAMKLRKLRLNGFRSVKKEQILRVDEKTTILIGANDHGKSNLLDATLHLNDDMPFAPDDRNWDLPVAENMAISWHFELNEATLQQLKELQPPPSVATTDAGLGTEEQQDSSPEAIPAFPLNADNEIVYRRQMPDNVVAIESVPLNIPISKAQEILALRPRVELFTLPHSNVVDEITLSQLMTPEFEFMQGIFLQAGLWDTRETIFAQTDSNSMMLDEASKKLTTVLVDKWKQGKELEWKLAYSGTNGDHIILQIKDPSVSTRYTRPSLRSSGFKTYFLLSMIINARTHKNASGSYIYLFDEPGTYLHPHAQLDLQKSFESIADNAQLIYTTHALFLINKNYPDRNRVVSKTKEGTKIDQKPFIKNWKSVRESLGILLSNNFLIAEKTLLTEGPSDVIYFIDAIKKVKREKKADVDLNDLSVVDAGNSENYVAMAKLMLSEGREVVALLDGDKTGDNSESQLKKVCAKELGDKKLQIRKLKRGKSVEDLFCDIGILRTAVKNVFNNLTATSGARKPAAWIDIEKAVGEINQSADETLGRTMDNITKKLFEPEEKMSKLSIALEYESLGGANKTPVEAQDEVEAIRDLLKLKGEKAAEAGVFEEVE